MSTPEKLVKVVVDLPNHWATGGESMWARSQGSDLYELRNVAFHAYGLNYLDVVRAVASSRDLKPEVNEVIRPSGHRTLRVMFTEQVEESARPSLLQELSVLKAEFEGATPSYFAIDVEPDGDYSGVCDRLSVWEDQGILEYETCEARIPGSFDAESDQ